MTSTLSLEVLLFLLPHLVCSEEPEPMFRAKGSNIEMGYCFGVDYIAVYRSAPEGHQLLGNSSANSSVTPPPDLQGRIHVNQQQYLLGLQISNLTHMDSGIYKKECWQNHTLVSQLTQQLFVCDKELESQEIIVNETETGTELTCSSASTRLEGTSYVRWYYETYPAYKITLLLNSRVSLKPLVEELQSLVKVKDKGAVLVLDNSFLKTNQHFYCLVIKGKDCLSFKNMYLLHRSESREIFTSPGEKVVLSCPSDGSHQQWETPRGIINGKSITAADMYLSGDKDFSLVIPSVSDEHSGEYSCTSSSLEIIFLLVLCNIKDFLAHHIEFVEGKNILLKCDVDQTAQRVLWYRQQTLMEDELIHDSNDKTTDVPEDLRDRVILSEHGSSLTISDMTMKDEGVYFCVVLRGHEFLVDEDFNEDDYNDEDTGDDELDYQNWNDSHLCISKQKTILTWINDNPHPKTTSSANSDVFVYVIVGGLVLMVVVTGVIVTVIALRRRARNAASGGQQDVY